ncbi:MAG: hypothetical protein AB7I37_18035 [Pirellulales bacterium]
MPTVAQRRAVKSFMDKVGPWLRSVNQLRESPINSAFSQRDGDMFRVVVCPSRPDCPPFCAIFPLELSDDPDDWADLYNDDDELLQDDDPQDDDDDLQAC